MTQILQPRLYLAILAGGQSTRARRGDSSAPKQFREVAGEALFLHGLRELAHAPGIARAVVVVPDAWRPIAEQSLEAAALPLPVTLAPAGRHRTESAWRALQALAGLPAGQTPAPSDLVAVHDAARPFATRHLLGRLARAAARSGAAVPGVPVTDTIVQLDAEAVAADPAGFDEDAGLEVPVGAYLERRLLVAVQTPQVCRWRELYAAHAWAAAERLSFTDDGGLVAARGVVPVVVMGERANWKITTEDDWQRAVAQLRREAVR
ncbi:MAG TPA: 2-C-methyl-D-erythritol 4-phosphate cytidylyltransferase [Candidatus Krumholzibacteria bacterium]|nr:2-C-methyl-D-erythritol 4-phosphate cytidylyltransferase [Candidatus Krumholzibacteria bacterium]HPD71997.1 2-C-methyl-D-erythritol 4-phosphate cytidylyltransferase [Candidatus Krumholzibacteria bacterium]HRY41070.1 2-C-methyl-D-erythritol 4-phosphate cytidylyltransferase [Candidatus Krumholzibacteria bacterium]